MPDPTKIPATLRPIAEELLENGYARENIQEGAEKLRDAYDRSQKRRVKPSKDRKLRKQIETAVRAIDEGTAALASGRQKPKRTGRNVVLVLIGAALAAAGFVLARDENLRKQVLGSAQSLGDEISGAPQGGDGASAGTSS